MPMRFIHVRPPAGTPSVPALASDPCFMARPAGHRPPSGDNGPERACRLAAGVIAARIGVDLELLLSGSRSRATVAQARQLAMYVANVALGLPQSDVARGFGRDRSTVAHACQRVEDRRDDPAFDEEVGHLEGIVRFMAGM